MITPVYTIEVDDRNLMLHLEQLPMALKSKLRPTIVALTNVLLARVRASEPRRTGRLQNLTRSYVNEREDFIGGRVRVLGGGQAHNIAAAALEYGVKRQAVSVPAYRRESIAVRAYERHTQIAARRFLRNPAAAMRERALTEISAAVDEAVAEVGRQ
jgi:hypothetical protein